MAAEVATYLVAHGKLVPGTQPDPRPALRLLAIEDARPDARELRDLATVLAFGAELRRVRLKQVQRNDVLGGAPQCVVYRRPLHGVLASRPTGEQGFDPALVDGPSVGVDGDDLPLLELGDHALDSEERRHAELARHVGQVPGHRSVLGDHRRRTAQQVGPARNRLDGGQNRPLREAQGVGLHFHDEDGARSRSRARGGAATGEDRPRGW